MTLESQREAHLQVFADSRLRHALEILIMRPEKYDREVGGVEGSSRCCQDEAIARCEGDAGERLKALVDAGLLRMIKNGPYMMCSVERRAIKELADYFGELARKADPL